MKQRTFLPHPGASRAARLPLRGLALLAVSLCLLTLAACSTGFSQLDWQLNDSVNGHMPDLQFNLTDDTGQAVTADDYSGKVVLLYFGYTHCPDVCPLTLAHLHQVMQQLGDRADNTRILFVSVDPARDTPEVMHDYVNAFDQHIVGLTGNNDQIKSLAKRYRVSYHRGNANDNGNYEVSHSSGVYVFDEEGHLRLLATSGTTPDAIAHDVKQLLDWEKDA